VGFFDALLGRTRLRKPDMDRIFALATAAPSLADRAAVAYDGRAGVCLRPVEGADWAQATAELQDLVQLVGRDRDFHSETGMDTDALGFAWVLVRGPDLGEAVTLAHLVGSTVQEKGFGEQLLAAVFRLRDEDPLGPAGRTAYLIYNYKRGAFYPFVPRDPGARTRDHAAEFRLSAALADLVPVEKDLTRWFALWDSPV
jgi:hypothetical protein